MINHLRAGRFSSADSDAASASCTYASARKKKTPGQTCRNGFFSRLVKMADSERLEARNGKKLLFCSTKYVIQPDRGTQVLMGSTLWSALTEACGVSNTGTCHSSQSIIGCYY